MGRLLAIGAVLVGAYALWAGQNPGRAFLPTVPGALFAPTGTPGSVVGKSAVAAARRAGG
jgi:hypothetical protein